MAETGGDGNKDWHLDKRVNISIIGAVVVQTAMGLWWASALNTRVEQLERNSVTWSNQDPRIVRLETKMDAIFQTLTEIKTIVRPNPHGER